MADDYRNSKYCPKLTDLTKKEKRCKRFGFFKTS
jgi:hypothetical protein